MMVGGDRRPVATCAHLRSAGTGRRQGLGTHGPGRLGHFVKMVHNGIEYGIMQAYAEGFAILEAKEEFDSTSPRSGEVWQHGS